MPSIQKLYQSTDTSKVAFVLLSLDDQFEKATNYAASQKLKLPLYYPTQQLPALFNVEGIPATFIFSESGELMKRIDGMENYDTKAFRDLLK
jgi:thioredoxin-related protein